MRLFRVLFCTAALMVLAGSAFGQCRVEGQARNEDGSPLAGATVRLEIADVRQPQTTTVGEDGRYVFQNVKPGSRVHLVVIHEGRLVAEAYSLVTLWVEPIDLTARAVSARVSGDWDLDPGGGPAGSVIGVVRGVDGGLVPAARVVITDTTMTATTDSAGRFVFSRLRSGASIDIEASAPGFKAATAKVIVPDEKRNAIDLTLRRADANAEPGTNLSPLYSADDSSEVSARTERLAGVPSLGRNDVFRGLQFLPGVSGTSEESGELYVRGGTPGENLVTLDAFTLYPVQHVFGPFSTLNSDAISGADLSKAAVDASDGGRLSGVVRVTGSTGTGRPTASADFSMLGTRAVVSLPIGQKASVLVAARRSFRGSLGDQALDALADDGTTGMRDRPGRYSGGTFAFEPTSSLGDLNAKLEVAASAKDRLSASFYDATEDANNSRDLALTRSTSISVPYVLSQLPPDTAAQWSDLQTWTARGLGAAWTRRWSPTAVTTVSIGRSTTSTSRGRSSVLTSPTTGVDYSFLGGRAGSDALTDTNRVEDTTLRFVGEVNIGFGHALTFGAETSAIDTNYGIETEVMASPGGASTSSLRSLIDRQASGRTIAAFIQDSWRPITKLTISPGVRLAHYDLTGSNDAEPRISASYELVPRLHLKGSASINHQQVYRLTYEDRLKGDVDFWALADGTSIPVPSSRQVTAGWSVDLPGVVLEMQGYYRELDDLTMLAPRLYAGTDVPASGALFHYGTGTARGIEALVQREWTRNTMWVAYTGAKTEYTFSTLENGAFPASQDQKHELKVADSFRILGRWWVSGAWVAATGRPYTPVEGAGVVWFPTGIAVTQATFGAKNSERLPAYHRLDLSTEREFRVRGFRSTVGLTVFNVYDRKNVRTRGYEVAGDTSYDLTYMGRVFNVFARVGF